ncbi:IS3 family transposase [Pseudomonas lini]|uniref:IS3 family transposase n=1 Tax=Pseudomonas lini TaxID=163011 RepID=UPI00345E914E
MSVRRICSVLGFARSSYYVKRKPEQRRLAQRPLELQIRALHKEHREALGARGLSKELRKSGIFIGRYRMGTLIKTLGLPRRRPRYAHYRRATKPAVTAPNILDRRFNPIQPNTLWAGDITYIKVKDSWLYLAVVMDLFSRRIVGWACSRTADTELSIKALRLAVALRRPMPELLFHSDQGCQYTADRFVACLAESRIVQSMSRRGNCWDNAVVERYFRTLKHDWMPQGGYQNHFEAEKDVMDFISHYNHRRCHTASNDLPPALFEQLAA